MAKFYGKIGYAQTVETSPGVCTEVITERYHRGDVTRNTRKLEHSEHLNDNINVGNAISILADGFAENNIYAMRYICWMGTRWRITDVDVQRPRLNLTIGGVYNGPTPQDGSSD